MDLTPTQRRMMAVLGDGMIHSKQELHACLNDDMAQVELVVCHISLLRKRIGPIGQDVVYVNGRAGMGYRLVRLVAPSSAS